MRAKPKALERGRRARGLSGHACRRCQEDCHAGLGRLSLSPGWQHRTRASPNPHRRLPYARLTQALAHGSRWGQTEGIGDAHPITTDQANQGGVGSQPSLAFSAPQPDPRLGHQTRSRTPSAPSPRPRPHPTPLCPNPSHHHPEARPASEPARSAQVSIRPRLKAGQD